MDTPFATMRNRQPCKFYGGIGKAHTTSWALPAVEFSCPAISSSHATSKVQDNMRQHAWSVDLEETQVNFQLIDYGVQVFAWAGTGPNLKSLFVAVPGVGDFPAVTSLLEATPSNHDESTFCGRLSVSPATLSALYSFAAMQNDVFSPGCCCMLTESLGCR